jgi:hypothetical protein
MERTAATTQTEKGVVRTLDTVIERLRAEFMEMPGLRLTGKPVQRLCGVEPSVCDVVLAALVDERFLCAKSDGIYVRVSDGNLLRRRRPAKADLHLSGQAKAS